MRDSTRLSGYRPPPGLNGDAMMRDHEDLAGFSDEILRLVADGATNRTQALVSVGLLF